ncbi:MAG: nuclear transport factor 2 family protein [Acidimicrobiia bacterium]|nr:nuclear transport factor 2 family protein [Acidimicrobiia bacterium]
MSIVQTSAAADLETIGGTLQTYFDGLYEGDTAKLAEAFHSAAHLYSVGPDGRAVDLPLATWLEVVAKRPSAAANGDAREDMIVTIDQSGPATAFAKVRCQLPPRFFTDYLTLVKADGRWQIIAKAFHTDTRD